MSGNRTNNMLLFRCFWPSYVSINYVAVAECRVRLISGSNVWSIIWFYSDREQTLLLRICLHLERAHFSEWPKLWYHTRLAFGAWNGRRFDERIPWLSSEVKMHQRSHSFVALSVGISQLIWPDSFGEVRRGPYLSFFLSIWPLKALPAAGKSKDAANVYELSLRLTQIERYLGPHIVLCGKREGWVRTSGRSWCKFTFDSNFWDFFVQKAAPIPRKPFHDFTENNFKPTMHSTHSNRHMNNWGPYHG